MLASFVLSPSLCCARRPCLSCRSWPPPASCLKRGRRNMVTSPAHNTAATAAATASSSTATTSASTATTTTAASASASSSTAAAHVNDGIAPVKLLWRRRANQDGHGEHDTDEVERGMSNLLIQHTPAQRAGLLVRRPMSFKRAVRVTLTMVLDGRAILHCLTTSNSNSSSNSSSTSASRSTALTADSDNDDDLVQTIQRMTRQYQEHMQRITAVLTHLRRHDNTLRVQIMHKTSLHLTLPDSLFFPHAPSKARACAWLQTLGVQPGTPGFELQEETYTSTCAKQHHATAAPSAVVGPGYFRDIQLFLDQVDRLIENTSPFGSSPSPNNRIPTSS